MVRRDVVIVGGGIAGLTLAYELGKRGADVALLDGAGGALLGGAGGAVLDGSCATVRPASTVPAALLNPHRGRTARARASDVAGLEAFWRLVSELDSHGLDHGARRTGVLRVAPSARQARLWRDVAASHEGVLWLEPGETPSPVNAPHGAVSVTRGGFVEPAKLLPALARAARARGVEVHQGIEATGVTVDGGDVRVSTTTFAVPARHVVLCVGASDAPSGCRLPSLVRDGGVAAVLRLPDGLAARGLPPIAGAVNAAFVGDRAVVTGGSLPPEPPSEEAFFEAAAGLRDAFSWAIPDVRGTDVVEAWFGVRARRPSGTPVVRRLAPDVTLYGALAGRGFLCAADLSARLAGRLVGGPRG